MRRYPLSFAAGVALTTFVIAGCSREPAETADAAPAQPAAAPAEAAPPAADPNRQPGTDHAFVPEIAAKDFSAHVQTLASDAFEGRAPGSPGEDRTVEYLQAQFERLGLKPGAGDSYFQTVPMVVTTADPATALTLTIGDATQTLAFGKDMVVGTRTGQPDVKVDTSELVFVGYGVAAAEQNWNDYAGLDVKGKTVVMLVNDPGFHAGDESLFEGRRMTYYGRWTYKFEEAARQGAAAALIVHDTEGAGYGWEVVKNSWSGEQFDLPASEDPEPRLPLQGWITGDAAKTLFAAAGQDLDALRTAAGKRGFKPMPLAATASVDLKSTTREASSRNVLALLPGSKRPDEAVVYMAHWDHLGKHADEPGDNIYNGAIDNATGVAGILEIAEQFAAQKPAPERSVLFAAVTLEESGLLGSKYYVAHPTIPLADTVAVINLDAMPVLGKTRDFTVIGFGNSELEDILKPIAQLQNRTLKAEDEPEKGFYFRSDHFNFAKAGVPALYARGGVDHVEKGAEYGKSLVADYSANRYHKPADQFDPDWDLAGALDDLNALYGVGRELTASDKWPNWYAGNPFRAAREASRKTP